METGRFSLFEDEIGVGRGELSSMTYLVVRGVGQVSIIDLGVRSEDTKLGIADFGG